MHSLKSILNIPYRLRVSNLSFHGERNPGKLGASSMLDRTSYESQIRGGENPFAVGRSTVLKSFQDFNLA